ncbi:unnamed protein product [Musa acuminata subsp. burmannicoides]
MRLPQTHSLKNGMKRGKIARRGYFGQYTKTRCLAKAVTTLRETTGHGPPFSGHPPRPAALRLGSGVSRRGSRGGEGALVPPPALLVHKYLAAAALHAAERSVPPAGRKPTRPKLGERANGAEMRMSGSQRFCDSPVHVDIIALLQLLPAKVAAFQERAGSEGRRRRRERRVLNEGGFAYDVSVFWQAVVCFQENA